jgi:hypothetical protein
MEYINVRGLPEPVARALERMVEALRRKVWTEPSDSPQPVPGDNGGLHLDHRRGQIIGRLTREELYDDVA